MYENEQDKIAFRDKKLDKIISPFIVSTKEDVIVWPPVENECADINMFFHNKYPKTILFNKIVDNIYISKSGNFYIDINNTKKVFCYCEGIKYDTKIIEYKRGDLRSVSNKRSEKYRCLMDNKKHLLNKTKQIKEDILRIEIEMQKLKEQKNKGE